MAFGSRKSSSLQVLSRREAAIFGRLTDSYCAPAGAFPAVSQTDSVAFIDDLTARSPRRNRLGFRALLTFIDLLPLLRGYRARLCKLDAARRDEFLRNLDKSRWPPLSLPGKLMKTLTMMSYYGSDGALHAAGYDPQEIVARGRALRREQGR